MFRIKSDILLEIIMPVADAAMKTSVRSSYKLIKKLNKLTRDEIIEWQNHKLQNLIKYAYSNTKYYNKIFNNVGIDPSDVKTINDLKKIPVLTRNDIKKNFNNLISNNIDSISHKKSSTGGSTGEPMQYYHDYSSWSMCNANYIINWEKSGYRYGDKYIALGSTSLFVDKTISIKHKLYYNIKNKVPLNGINMSDETCNKYVNLIKNRKIHYIYGYASSIYLLAKYVLKNNIELYVKACFPTSEILKDQYRKIIYDAFRCIIIDTYGANDGGVNAFALKKGYFEVGYNSIVRQNNINNEYGPLLITDLYNYAMPFINYQVGDEVLIKDSANKDYSYNGQIINEILGRSSDIVSFNNGSKLTGPGFTILFKDIPVEYYCIEKTSHNSLICWLIKTPDFNSTHEELILSTLKKQTRRSILISIKEINKPFISKSGKKQYFIDTTK